MWEHKFCWLSFCIFFVAVTSVNAQTLHRYGSKSQTVKLFSNGDWQPVIDARKQDQSHIKLATGDHLHAYVDDLFAPWNARYEHTGMFRWQAPEGQIITQVNFDVYDCNGNERWFAAVRVPVGFDAHQDMKKPRVVWEQAGVIKKDKPESAQVSFKPEQAVRAIELGFHATQNAQWWRVRFGNVVIQTQKMTEEK
jgi:hypothetical protein